MTPEQTRELIAEARRQVGRIEDKSIRERLISDLADALEDATHEHKDDAEILVRSWRTFPAAGPWLPVEGENK